MREILAILMVFTFLRTEAQDVISETQSIIVRQDTIVCNGDTISPIYYLMTERVIDNGTSYPDTSRTVNLIKSAQSCPADSTSVAEQIYNSAVNRQLEMSGYVGKAFQRQQYVSDFNYSSTLFESVTGKLLIDATSEIMYTEYANEDENARYRVFTDTSNFFAYIHQLGNGRWRLRQLDGLNGNYTGTQWVINPRSRNNFQLLNFDAGFGAENYEFFSDQRPGADGLFWPAQRVRGETGAVRIAKVR